MKSTRFARLAACIAAAAIGACSPAGGGRAVPPAGTTGLLTSPNSATQHLYVIVTTSTRFVAEYPIENGIPASKPDRVVRGFRAPNALTVDSAGDLYVLDLKTIKEFAPGASGHARPIREIDVPSFLNINTLAVDANGYLYVGQSNRVNVYAPDAHGAATPIAKFRPVGYPAGFTVDGKNDFYTLGNTQKVISGSYLQFQTHTTIYSPAPKIQRVRGFCTHWLEQSGIEYGIALDSHSNAFTTHTYFIGSVPQGEIDVFPPGADRCPMNPASRITTSNPTLREPVYLAIDGPYLYVGDVYYGQGGAIFTLRTEGKHQKPLSTLYVNNDKPHDVFGIATGP